MSVWLIQKYLFFKNSDSSWWHISEVLRAEHIKSNAQGGNLDQTSVIACLMGPGKASGPLQEQLEHRAGGEGCKDFAQLTIQIL